MIQYTLRFFKRFAILLPGIVIAYFSVRDIFPYIDRKITWDGGAIIITYALAAYVLVPATIRLVRIIRPASHLPLYSVTTDGFAADPLNLALICTRRQLIQAMETIGWKQADRITPKTVVRTMVSAVVDAPYSTAPVSNLYLFGRKQDLSFQKHIGDGGPFSRHHVRFWATTYEQAAKGDIGIHGIHWLHRQEHVREDNLLWVGAASLDAGITLIRHNLQISHMVDPDTNKERELIINQLKKAGLIAKTQSTKLDNPYRLANQVLRGFMHTDGKMTIATLKK